MSALETNFHLRLVFKKSAHFLYKKIVKPKSPDEDLSRREFILNTILLGYFGLFITASIVMFVGIVSGDPSVIFHSFISIVLITVIILLLLLLSRTGYFVLASYLFVALNLTFATYLIYTWGVELVAGILFYILTIIISGILINTRFAFVITMLSSAIIIVLSYLQTNGLIKPDLYWKEKSWEGPELTTLFVIFLIIATVCWLSNREIEKSLARARKSEAEVKEQRDLLEIRVEQRTEELRKAQIDKMAHVFKMAEFGRLSSGLFHDLISPLNAVSLNIEKIKNNSQLKGKMREVEVDLEKTFRATERMTNFISSIKKQIIYKESQEYFSLNKEIEETIEVLKYHARKRKVELIFHSKDEVQVLGNPFKFNQVMLNLISNGIDAIDGSESGRVEIDLEETNQTVKITVADSGRGIPKEILSQIFEPFFTTKELKKDKGTGIGLSICKHIVEKDFNGTITVQSQENQGTKFIIQFNLVK